MAYPHLSADDMTDAELADDDIDLTLIDDEDDFLILRAPVPLIRAIADLDDEIPF